MAATMVTVRMRRSGIEKRFTARDADILCRIGHAELVTPASAVASGAAPAEETSAPAGTLAPDAVPPHQEGTSMANKPKRQTIPKTPAPPKPPAAEKPKRLYRRRDMQSGS